ncbi:hypothetical protein VKT23_015076 [Stygiomarasmius scandens]|uniref:Uncharacterized protein n=1 Tax=Marasmiellus scandens TaxID=2682957 RepID=A0ABR1IYN0_9AGAR
MSTLDSQTLGLNPLPANTLSSDAPLDALPSKVPISQVRPLGGQSADIRVYMMQKEVGWLKQEIEDLQQEARRVREEEQKSVIENAETARQLLLLQKNLAEARQRSLDLEVKHFQNLYRITRAATETVGEQLSLAQISETRALNENAQLSLKIRNLSGENEMLKYQIRKFVTRFENIRGFIKEFIAALEKAPGSEPSTATCVTSVEGKCGLAALGSDNIVSILNWISAAMEEENDNMSGEVKGCEQDSEEKDERCYEED